MINWRRGIFRVWIVSSVVWICTVAWQHRLDFKLFIWPDDGGYLLWDAQESSGHRLNDPSEVRRYSTDASYLANPLPRHPKIMLLLPREGLSENETQRRITKSDEIMADVDQVVNRMVREGLVEEFLPWALGPPIAALAVGWILLWVGAGFRKLSPPP